MCPHDGHLHTPPGPDPGLVPPMRPRPAPTPAPPPVPAPCPVGPVPSPRGIILTSLTIDLWPAIYDGHRPTTAQPHAHHSRTLPVRGALAPEEVAIVAIGAAHLRTQAPYAVGYSKRLSATISSQTLPANNSLAKSEFTPGGSHGQQPYSWPFDLLEGCPLADEPQHQLWIHHLGSRDYIYAVVEPDGR